MSTHGRGACTFFTDDMARCLEQCGKVGGCLHTEKSPEALTGKLLFPNARCRLVYGRARCCAVPFNAQFVPCERVWRVSLSIYPYKKHRQLRRGRSRQRCSQLAEGRGEASCQRRVVFNYPTALYIATSRRVAVLLRVGCNDTER